MKQYFFFIILLSTIKIFAQSPQMPNICLVTVENDSLVKLKWTHPDTTKIKGFIIKRKIFNGSGVVDGTLNNIKIIANTYLNYSDTSVSYLTSANPYIRSEEYAINSYLIRNDSTIFSYLTFSQKTIFLNVSWDECVQKASFSWNKYINRNILKYQLFYSLDNISYTLLKEFLPDDTTFLSSSFTKNTQYYFKINAILESQGTCATDTSISNVANLYTYSPTEPTELIGISVSTIDNNCINLKFHKNGGNGIEKIILLKNNNDKIAEFLGDETDILFFDFSDVQTKNCYQVEALDTCGNVLKESNKVCNIVLNVVQNNNVLNFNYNTTKIRELMPDNYFVYIDINNQWQEFMQIEDTLFSIKLSEIFQNQTNILLKDIGFKIRASKGSDEVFSNFVYLPLAPIITVPNAINPQSNNSEDRYFTVKSMFINAFEIVIFTENNEIVFQSKDINNSWNGYLNNSNLAPCGAYVYTIKYLDNSNVWHKKSGVVNLIY